MGNKFSETESVLVNHFSFFPKLWTLLIYRLLMTAFLSKIGLNHTGEVLSLC
jgi:hypothetical protein